MSSKMTFSPLENMVISAILETKKGKVIENECTMKFREFVETIESLQWSDTEKICRLCNLKSEELVKHIQRKIFNKTNEAYDTFKPDDDITLKLGLEEEV